VSSPRPLADAWREVRRVLDPDGRVALVAPDWLVDEAISSLGLEPVLRNPVSVLGRHVEIAVLARDGQLTAPQQLFAREIDEAFERYVAVATPGRAESGTSTCA
jgi:hypothetical protein